MSSVNQILSELYRDCSGYSCNHEGGRRAKPDAAALSQLLMVKNNPNIPQSQKRELKPFLSIPVPTTSTLGTMPNEAVEVFSVLTFDG